ncbi:hypothetical protein K0M31_008623 [Melipona bicolor]|uniref:Uncharacterized protein n=1 Tax=Melipona bicolor TaxID=60889 RepID=A0AA40KJR1_9HYME|nr:hypothetical protein K0M31_008623 [Melipona bicolor]
MDSYHVQTDFRIKPEKNEKRGTLTRRWIWPSATCQMPKLQRKNRRCDISKVLEMLNGNYLLEKSSKKKRLRETIGWETNGAGFKDAWREEKEEEEEEKKRHGVGGKLSKEATWCR